jgi:diguanylate cyclase (GGDEF)-like protein/PAS domain S-box-containing protein
MAQVKFPSSDSGEITLFRPNADYDTAERLRAKFKHRAKITPAMLHSVNEQGIIITVSDAWLNKLGYTRSQVIGRPSVSFLTPESRERALREVLPVFFRCGCMDNVQYQMVCKNGSVIDVLMSAVLDDSPIETGPISLAVITDITALKDTKRQLLESEARYRLLADHSSDVVFHLGLDLVRRYVSPSCREILGYEPEEMVGAKPLNLVHPDEAVHVRTIFQSLLDGEIVRQSVINRMRHKDGHWVWVEAELRTLKDPATGAALGLIGAMRDITARREMEDRLAEANRRLEALAAEDALTGLRNRRVFNEALTVGYRAALRHGRSLGLLMIDVDWFKAYNDHYGHPAGDECLRQVAKVIARTVRRAGDTSARYGGEEFAILLPETDERGVIAMGERIRGAVNRLALEHLGSGNQIVTISVGAASIKPVGPGDGEEFLLRQADRALYRAKALGRNRVFRASDLG